MYQYDLDLQQTGPPHHRVEVKTHVFEAPSEEFRGKLMRGGGVPVFGANIAAAGSLSRTLSPSVGGDQPGSELAVVKAKGSGGSIVIDSGSGSSKKHKPRNDDTGKVTAFSALWHAHYKRQ